MLVALVLPFSIFLGDWEWQLIIVGIFLSFISINLVVISYRILLSTNNPADRKNIFSINKRFNHNMKGSVADYGWRAIEIQEPTNEEINTQKKKERKKKLKKLYESKI